MKKYLKIILLLTIIFLTINIPSNAKSEQSKLQTDSNTVLNLMLQNINKNTAPAKDQEAILDKYILDYHNDNFYKDSNNLTQQDHIMLDNIWYAKICFDKYFKHDKDTTQKSIDYYKKCVLDTCNKYIK